MKSKSKIDFKPESERHNIQAAKTLDNQSMLEIKRHWFGLISLYVLMGFGILAVIFLISFINGSWQDNPIVFSVAILFIIVIVCVLFVLIGKIYKSNILTISQIEVRQITREALFLTKTSVLGLANIEDVTTVRNGFFAHVFNYGTLNIETAGEQENFMFRYCPKPEECARSLMRMREDYLNETKQDQVLR